MTSRNMCWKNSPFLLKPTGRNDLWGGTRLKKEFNKELDLEPLSETWECSTHPDGQSMVVTGKHTGQLLGEVLKRHPEYFGTHPKPKGELPVLIKLIDAKEDLSIQVHPDDAYARNMENGSAGKTEFWYILDARKDAKLIYGFHHTIEKETLKQALETGMVEKYLQKVKVEKDDVFYIEAGTVHAIGGGILLAEIQENSNLTYRLYDYNRVDRNGKGRELHIKKALDVAELKAAKEPRQPMRVLKYQKGCASELICRCKYFQVERQIINTECCRRMVDLQTGSNSFQVLLCIEGCGCIFESEKEVIHFFKGDCIFIPADSSLLKLHGKAQMLKVSC